MTTMLQNYLKIAVRNLLGSKGYTFINVAGLAVGLAACVLILVYVREEFSYDHFHENADRIYRIGLDAHVSGTDIHTATTSAGIAPILTSEYPEVEEAVRFFGDNEVLVQHRDRQFRESAWRWADSTVFKIFSLPFVTGDPATALDRPFTVVLSESSSARYFGTTNPIGQTLRLNGADEYEVTGVIKDLPHTAHFPIDFLASFSSLSWVDRNNTAGNNSFLTYVLLREGASAARLTDKFPDLIQRHVVADLEMLVGSWDEAVASGFRWSYFLEPLTDIHLYSTTQYDLAPHADVRYLYVLIAVAVFILLIACINFMNLSTARSASRAKEVGIRRVVGSKREQLVLQFLGESVLLALVAALIAFGLVFASRPVFNILANKPLMLEWTQSLTMLAVLTAIALLTGLLAGLYPAAVLSSFKPISVLKGGAAQGARGVWLRRVLVVTQFGISIVLLIATGVVFKQLRYMQNEKLGFAGEQVVVIHVISEAVQDGFMALRQQLLQHPNIIEVAAGNGYPGNLFESLNAFRPEGASDQDVYAIYQGRVSPEYFRTLQVNLIAGREFSRSRDFNLDSVAIVNEAAASMLGYTPDEAIGKGLREAGDGENPVRTIIGVTENFHLESLQETVKPIVVSAGDDAGNWWMNYVIVRLSPHDVPATLSFLETQWKSYDPDAPYEYAFLNEEFARLYENERQLGHLFGTFAGLAVLIACLGLFGLASFVTEQRTKEIGVRKVLGASAPNIVVLLSQEFTKMVLVAALLAFPIGYFAMNTWLADFAYRTNMGVDVFALAGVLALLIAWLTVSYQAVKAALANPVKSLRYE